MKLTDVTKRLLAELEDEIGWETYNPNSYDGWHDEEGCAYRYPITIPYGEENNMCKIKDWDQYLRFFKDCDVSLEQLKEMRYKFGSNELYIGRGLINVLTYLEKRYGIDIEKLETEYINENLSQKYFTIEDCYQIEKSDNLTGKVLVLNFSDEEKKYTSPRYQLIYCDNDYGSFISAYRCCDNIYIGLLHDKIDDCIGIATDKLISKWHEKYGDFDPSIERKLKDAN